MIVFVSLLRLSLLTLGGVSPHQITDYSLQRNLDHSVLFHYVLHFKGLRRNASMDTEILVVNNTSEREMVKNIHNAEIKVLIVLLTTLFIKVETLSHLTGLMVPSQHENIILIIYFHRHKENKNFHSKGTPIYVIP